MNVRTYKVHKVYRNSGRRVLLRSRLTEAEAQRVVQSYPDSQKHMVVYTNFKKS